jgi:hypothetical protein
MHRAWLGHWSGGLAVCFGELDAARWVEVVAVEASASAARTLGLKIWPLRRKLRAGHLYWHWWLVHLEWLEKLVRLHEARPNITPRGLSREWHFPLAILLHFSDLVFNDNGLVDHVLEVGVVGVEQLELNIIIQPIQEHVLLLLVCVDVVRAYLDN